MLILPQTYLPKTFAFLIGNMRNTFASRALGLTKKVSIDEASHYLRQAIDLCYRSRWTKMPYEFLNWIQNNIKINYLDLPQDVRDWITNILFHSEKIKATIQNFIINLPK